jgi:DnaJ-class molecular chaperone
MGFLVLVGIVVVAGYLFSLRVHPLRKCPACKMTGRHFGSIYTSRYRRCRMCGGTGRKDRLGAKVFFGGTGDSGIYPKH